MVAAARIPRSTELLAAMDQLLAVNATYGCWLDGDVEILGVHGADAHLLIAPPGGRAQRAPWPARWSSREAYDAWRAGR